MNSHGTSWSMAKSYYAALIGISIDKGEIGSLDDAVAKYLLWIILKMKGLKLP